MTTLTKHDTTILSALFDAESSPSRTIPIDKQLPSLPHYSESDFVSIRAEELAIIQPLNLKAPDTDTIRDIVQRLSSLISRFPSYASAYINLAQARRLVMSVDDIFSEGHESETAALLANLGTGIDLASPKSPTQPISDHQASVLAAGCTHRGFLLLKAADLRRKGQLLYGVGQPLQTATAEQIEDLASRDFAAGARYGNKIAKDMSVRTNPYAKMCGVIVKEAIRKEIDEYRSRASA